MEELVVSAAARGDGVSAGMSVTAAKSVDERIGKDGGDDTVVSEEEDEDNDNELQELVGDCLDDVALDQSRNKRGSDVEDGGVQDEELDRLMGIDADGIELGESGVDGAALANAAPPPPERCCLGRARKPYKIGRITVLFPSLFETTGWGSFGPQWCGTVCTLSLLFSSSYYYIGMAFRIGPFSGAICVAFAALSTICLVSVAFSDPGVITARGQAPAGGGGAYAGLPQDGRDLSDWRYCDLCRYGPHCVAN